MRQVPVGTCLVERYFSCQKLVCRERAVMIIAARNDRRRVVAVVYLFVIRGESVNIKTVRVEEIGQFLGTVDVNCLAKA